MYSTWFRSTFRRVLKFLHIKERNQIFGWNQFCRKSELFARPPLPPPDPLCIAILNVLWTHTLRHSLDFNASRINQEYFSQRIFYKLKRGDLISWGKQFCRKSELFGSFDMYFNYLFPLICIFFIQSINCPCKEAFSQIAWSIYCPPKNFWAGCIIFVI